MNNLVIEADLQKIIVGTWLVQASAGEPITDIDMFEPRHIDMYPGVVGALKNGVTDPIEICRRADIEPHALAELMSQSQYKYLYGVGVEHLQKRLADEWIVRHPDATPMEIAGAMERYSRKTSHLPTVTPDPVGEMINELDRRAAEKPVSTGLPGLDRLLCGVRKKELTAVGARPSVGKSAFLQQVAMKVAQQGEKVLFFPLEMSEFSIMIRMLLRYTDIPQNELRNGLSRETWEREATGIEQVQQFMDSGNFMIFERCNDIEKIKELIDFHKPYMVAIDQLEQLESGNQRWDDKRQRFSYMTHEMQAISLDQDVAVWFACQANRSASDTPPTLASFKESGTIEEDVTNAILLHREGEKMASQNIQVDLAKQKDGACGVFDTIYDAPHFTFRCLDWMNTAERMGMSEGQSQTQMVL